MLKYLEKIPETFSPPCIDLNSKKKDLFKNTKHQNFIKIIKIKKQSLCKKVSTDLNYKICKKK